MTHGLSDKTDRVMDHLFSVFNGYRMRVPSVVATELLLYCDGWHMKNGHMVDVRARSIGHGVSEVWLEPRNPAVVVTEPQGQREEQR